MPESVSFSTLSEMAAIGFAAGFLITLILVPKLAGYMRRRGMVGVDVHKSDRPQVPEMIGLAILAGLVGSCLLLVAGWPSWATRFLAFTTAVLVAATVGAVDDLKGLGAKTKPLLTMLSSLPILLLGVYDPHPVLPFVGATRLTIVYPLVVPVAMAVTANAMNMADPVNGAMSGSSAIILLGLLASSLLLGRNEATVLSATMLGPVLAFFIFNRYPSRVFSGDVGSLTVGAGLGAIVVLGGLEVIGIVAMMPQIMNAFYILSSTGGLIEHSTMRGRPVKVLPDGRLDANLEPQAPMTLTRIILARGPLRENEIAREFFQLTFFSTSLALLTALTLWSFRV